MDASMLRPADHPHVGGENSTSLTLICLYRGPSPRGWGELGSIGSQSHKVRTIPTWVGRTSPRRRCGRTSTDHPHVGGENCKSREVVSRYCGPSPRGWGELQQPPQFWLFNRTIPTWVGRTARVASTWYRKTDHPHVGGENDKRGWRCWAICGPSPRGWGELAAESKRILPYRTIPTWVGRTPPLVGVARVTADHPHVGGENFLIMRFVALMTWTIPTWVGRTAIRWCAARSMTDHPHVGGENGPTDWRASENAGPSPRGWGEPLRACAGAGKQRTIPTWVGRTWPPWLCSTFQSDHPHVGGENAITRSPGVIQTGPSPRGWGERGESGGSQWLCRTIPTWVGRTFGGWSVSR